MNESESMSEERKSRDPNLFLDAAGSDLSISEAHRLVPGQNATTVQVAAGVLGAVLWMIEHPNEGVCVPDDLPYDYVLNVAKPYLGTFISQEYDWTPVKNQKVFKCFPFHIIIISSVPEIGVNVVMRHSTYVLKTGVVHIPWFPSLACSPFL